MSSTSATRTQTECSAKTYLKTYLLPYRENLSTWRFAHGGWSQDMTDARLELPASMLVRAYDPCISCSVR